MRPRKYDSKYKRLARTVLSSTETDPANAIDISIGLGEKTTVNYSTAPCTSKFTLHQKSTGDGNVSENNAAPNPIKVSGDIDGVSEKTDFHPASTEDINSYEENVSEILYADTSKNIHGDNDIGSEETNFHQNSTEDTCMNLSDDKVCDKMCADTPITVDEENERGFAAENLLLFIKQKEKEGATIEELLNHVKQEENFSYDNTFEDEFDQMHVDDDISEEAEDENSPLQPGHNLSLKSCVLLVWLFVVTHSLTSVQIADLLTLD